MQTSEADIDEETLKRVRERVLQEEDSQLHFERPPTIVQDIKGIIEEEVTDADLKEHEV